MKRVYIFSNGYTNRSFQGHTYFVPYIQLLLQSYFQINSKLSDKVEWGEIEYAGNNLDELIEEIEDPFLLGLSCYSWTWEKNMALAKEIKKRFPACHIVLGGPEVPVGRKDFFQEFPYVDYLVHKEGEKVFTYLLEKLLLGEEVSHPKISQRGAFADRSHIQQDLDFKERSFLDLIDYNSLNSLKEKLKSRNIVPAIIFETNRGCPYKCTFCDWGESTGQSVRNMTMETIERQIEEIAKAQYELVFCSDANFGINKRDEDIARMWVEAKKKYGYPKAIYFNTAKNTNKRILKIGEIIKEEFSIIPGNTISFQSMNSDVLSNVGRKNIGLKNYLNLQSEYENRGVDSYSELILGLPGESVITWFDGIVKLLNLGIKNFHIYPLLICENAPIKTEGHIDIFGLQVEKVQRSEHSFTLKGETLFEYADMVVASNTMSFEDYLEMNFFAEFSLTIVKTGILDFVLSFIEKEFDIKRGAVIESLYLNKENNFLGSSIDYLKQFCRENLDFLLRRDIGKREIDFEGTKVTGLISFQKYLELKLGLNLELFYEIVKDELQNNADIDNDVLDDLFSFQFGIFFKPSDLKSKQEVTFDYDWKGYFSGGELKRVRNTLIFDANWNSHQKNLKALYCQLKINSKLRVLMGKEVSNLNKVYSEDVSEV